MALTLKKWDVAEHLKTAEDIAAYLDAALEEGDMAFVYRVLGDVARSHGMTEIARTTGYGRESLYKALSGDRNPSFATVANVLRSLGLKLSVRPASVTDNGKAQLGA